MVKLGLLPTYRHPAVATPEYARGIAALAEDAGCESLWTVEHIVVPSEYSSAYPYAPGGRMPLSGDDPIPDPLEWLAFVAATTTRLRLGTCMLILPEHHPVHLAKRLATLDQLSGGRLIVGVGVGWMREEAEAMGVDFARRGAIADEYLDVLRALWQDGTATFAGEFVSFSGVRCVPKPAQPGGVPILVGGHSPAAARRAGRRGDGFYPLGVSSAALPALLETMRAEARGAGRDPDRIEITTGVPATVDEGRRLVDLGVSRFILSARSDGRLDQVRRLVSECQRDVIEPLG